ncbi:hypothetical protein [Arthrobacter oryzae]|uniref:hypothetical protein n=1 Tax=Arthrobacter oryzae TaxID=409290 RepID=UPI002859C6C5|nr:hypothetical protein [Arthrobacter oryzae]MDR6506028.1 hypothetical protein [Arthrobacter oryzae]
MDPLADAEPGAWLHVLLDPTARDMHFAVPHGYPAYARVFHPAPRDRPAGTLSWHRHDRSLLVEMDSEPATWATVAARFGKTMHPLAQFHRLVGPQSGPYGEILDADGWRYSAPLEGNLDVDVLAAAAAVLCRHTSTPDAGVAAVWEGWGGLTSAAGYARLTFGASDGEAAAGVWSRTETAEAGLLPANVVDGPRLELPGRGHFLFSAAPRGFTDPAWTRAAPWHHDPRWPQSPSLLWPEDRSWVLVTEIDFDSTVVAGSAALIAELVAAPRVEALRISEGADLTWDADALNRPPGA